MPPHACEARAVLTVAIPRCVAQERKVGDGRFDCSYNAFTATWDETKRLRNIKNHELDFAGCEAVFDGPVVSWDDDRASYPEQRINLLGWLNGIVVHMTCTERGDEPHIISLRRAEKHEIRRYAKEVAR